ncbi:MAG TPA: VWA domain-containing protein [Candidatus Polarisedimenticolaceae bacterium]|nr:VWA domain-containing protein [Candidatus Polarisedimenticolaceae bacterium]
MRFAAPEMLWLALSVPAMVLIAVWLGRRRRRALERFAGASEFVARFDGTVSLHRRAVKLLLLALALVGVIVAAARPQWGTRLEAVTRRGVDVVVLLDHSLSMAAEDVKPNRLFRANQAIDSLLVRLAGDRVALVTFAGEATLLCPLTLDHSAVRLFLDAVEAESTQVPGTALARALELSLEAFGESRSVSADESRAVLLLTDGEDHEGGIDEALRDLERAGVAVYTVGVGTTRGAPIPLADEAGMHTGYKKDPDGRVVTTRLEEPLLERIALESGGRYYRATAAQIEVDEITRALTGLDTQEFGEVLRARYEERFQVPLAVALLALTLEALIGDRRRAVEQGRSAG